MIGTRASARPKLVEPTGFDSPTRAELALIIAARTAALETQARLQAAREQLWTAYWTAQRAVEGAEATLQRAKEEAASYVVATAIGTAGEAPMTIKAARAALQNAEDDLGAALAARNGLDGLIGDAEREVSITGDRVKTAAVAVMRESPAVAAMLPEVLRLQGELIKVGRAMSWLVSKGIIPGGDQRGIPKPTDEHYAIWRTKNFIDALPVDYLLDADVGRRVVNATHPAAAPWDAALTALQTDPSAPLPGDDA